MEIKVDKKLLRLVSKFEKDSNKAMSEAIILWLKKKVITCPITNQFCEEINRSCNDCPELGNKSA